MASTIHWLSRWKTFGSRFRSSREIGESLKAHAFRAMPMSRIKCFPTIPAGICFLASIVIVAWAMLFGEGRVSVDEYQTTS